MNDYYETLIIIDDMRRELQHNDEYLEEYVQLTSYYSVYEQDYNKIEYYKNKCTIFDKRFVKSKQQTLYTLIRQFIITTDEYNKYPEKYNKYKVEFITIDRSLYTAPIQALSCVQI